MFSIRVEENATAEAESATGTSKLAPWPRLGTMILYGTSYQLPPACSFEYTEMLGQKFPSSITCGNVLCFSFCYVCPEPVFANIRGSVVNDIAKKTGNSTILHLVSGPVRCWHGVLAGHMLIIAPIGDANRVILQKSGKTFQQQC